MEKEKSEIVNRMDKKRAPLQIEHRSSISEFDALNLCVEYQERRLEDIFSEFTDTKYVGTRDLSSLQHFFKHTNTEIRKIETLIRLMSERLNRMPIHDYWVDENSPALAPAAKDESDDEEDDDEDHDEDDGDHDDGDEE